MSAEEDMVRLEELAISRLLGSLSTDEAEEYVTLKSRHSHFEDAAVEHLVVLAHLAIQPAAESVPRSLRRAVDRDADQFFGVGQSRHTAARNRVPTKHRFWFMSAGWCVGLAASIMTAFVWMHRTPGVSSPTTPAVASLPLPTVPAVPVAPRPKHPSPQTIATESATTGGATSDDLAAERRAFLESHPHSLERAWRPGGDPTGERVRGDVVWDAASQSGYMRFVDLRRNEPNAEQYQLWIFDAVRNQLYPVDGGVFDVSTRGGEQIIRIHAKLRVQVPLMFAVTVERPGGVVVSDRSRIAAIATVT